ncbi:MAG: serine/threonine protein kinase [Planctomycetota bacterium]|jgi:serine/threonine protein kinase
MARRRKRRRTPKKPPPEPKKRGPTEPGEPGTETSEDTRLVNALESDPGFFKDPLIGQTLGKCVISGLIGEGRTSVVYEATYKPLKRTVAVKVLQPEMTKYAGVVRVFQQEGRAVAALDHENVVKIFDVGEDQNVHYLVLERLRGQDVLKHIEQSDGIRLPVVEALEYTRQAAAGLAAAHRKNLIHRDIKPQNLVIEPNGTLKIVDFGLAAEAEGAFAGGRLGTPHYMSPEVCRGEMAGTAADIYGLGITLFHMLVGHAPYAGRKTTDEIVEGHLSAARFYPEKIRTDIPKPVADLVRRMTRMEAGNRPSAKEVVEFIAERLTPEKLGARHKVRAEERKGRRARRQRSAGPAYIAVGGVVLAVLLALVLMGGDDESPEPKKPKADLPRAPVSPPPTPGLAKPKQRHKEVTDKSLEKDLRELLAQAGQEERTGNLQEAHYLYTRVLVKAPPDSRYAAEAKAAAVVVEERLAAEVGIKRAPRKWITVRDSEQAGQEFAAKEQDFWTKLGNFEVQTVKDETEKLLKKTRAGSAERAAIELAMAKMRYIESLLSILQTRADSLAGADARWNNFDYEASEELLVMGADENGVTLKDYDMGTDRKLPWREIPAQVRIAFLETLRNPKSATETLWLGAYCKLLGDGAAEQYFNYALMLDSGPEMKAQIKALKGN